MMRAYLAAWGDREAYAVSHVGFGMNPGARYEALSMYDQRDTNGTEIRAVSGNFLFSTGANEFAGRYTAGHFDLPMMGNDYRTRWCRGRSRRRASGCLRLAAIEHGRASQVEVTEQVDHGLKPLCPIGVDVEAE